MLSPLDSAFDDPIGLTDLDMDPTGALGDIAGIASEVGVMLTTKGVTQVSDMISSFHLSGKETGEANPLSHQEADVGSSRNAANYAAEDHSSVEVELSEDASALDYAGSIHFSEADTSTCAGSVNPIDERSLVAR